MPSAFAQKTIPYASLNSATVDYHGPGRERAHDLIGPEIRIGLLAPLTGSRQAEGEALRSAAEMAIEDENAALLPGSCRLALVARDESGTWGRASSEIVRMVFDDRAVALITSTDGVAAHLAEQVGNKVGVPILTLSSDTTTTQINLPWIFRLGPDDVTQAQAFARAIYQERKLSRVLLLIQNDHDGRVGGEEFEKAARALNASTPAQITIDPEKTIVDALPGELSGAQAVVFWTDAATARMLAPRLRERQPSAPLYLCRKAVPVDDIMSIRALNTRASDDAGIWTVAARGVPSDSVFTRRYRQRFGVEPGIAAILAYDAVRLVAASLRQAGPNRARLRDALANVSSFAGASGVTSFDHAGNDTSRTMLLKLP